MKLSMDSCIFCKIINNEIPSQKIYENDDFLAILDIAQFVEGHTIVIPKKHYEFIWDIPEISEYMDFVNVISKHYIKDLGYKYVDTASFGRMVPHAHMHLVPHNGKNNDWTDALAQVGAMQEDKSRWKNSDDFAIINEKFCIN